MKNPIKLLLDSLPQDNSSVIITKDFCKQMLAWMHAADPKFSSMEHVDKLLWFLHQESMIVLSYTEASGERINYIRKNVNGY